MPKFVYVDRYSVEYQVYFLAKEMEVFVSVVDVINILGQKSLKNLDKTQDTDVIDIADQIWFTEKGLYKYLAFRVDHPEYVSFDRWLTGTIKMIKMTFQANIRDPLVNKLLTSEAEVKSLNKQLTEIKMAIKFLKGL